MITNSLLNSWKKSDWAWLATISALVLIYFYEVLNLQTGFYSGDHRQQHYPWAFFYAQQLKQEMLPWWTSLFGCGFPLLAEGQVGALYLPNFLFYKFFPFDFAYTYNILLHYICGAGFFYLLVRSRGISGFASFLGCLIYLFGTAQGGYYYNIISLKTLIWFPLTLYFIFRIFEEQKYKFLFWLALVFALQLCAGYLQYAVYSLVFCGISCLWCSILKIRHGQWKVATTGLAVAFTSVVLSILCALPQLGATWELSQFSNRFDFPIEFAFVGSVNPLAIATFFFPHWDGFLRAEIYFGAIGLLFFLHSFRDTHFKCRNYFILGFFISVGLALGGFNPIYRWAIEWTGFSSFRVPAKFIYFAGFYGSVLCAYGADAWLRQEDSSIKKSWRLWSLIGLLAGLGLVSSHYLLKILKGPLLSYFSDYINKNYAGSVIRPHSMEIYQQKLMAVYEGVTNATYPFERENLIFLFFIVFSWGLISVCRNQKWPKQTAMIIVSTVLFANLWAFGNTSVRGGLKTKYFLEPSSKIISYLKDQDNHSGRLHRVFRDIYGADKLPIMTHNNVLLGQPLVGAYSPLITKSFYEGMSDLGDVNDSNALKVSSREKFMAASKKIDFLNIKWILSDHKFSFDRYELLLEENDIFLYSNPHLKPRAQLMRTPNTIIHFTDAQNLISLRFNSEHADQLVLSDLFYPGWTAKLNSAPVAIERYDDLFRVIHIPDKGIWHLEMSYEPVWKNWLVPSMILASFLLVAPFLFWRRYE